MPDPTPSNQNLNAGDPAPGPGDGNIRPPGHPNNGEPQPQAPLWVKILSGVFGGITLFFFMVLIFFSLFGYTVPENSCYLVAIVFGIFGGLAFGFISGTAMASGAI